MKERAEFSDDLNGFVAILRAHLQGSVLRVAAVSDGFLKKFGRHLGDGRSTTRAIDTLESIFTRGAA